MNRIALLAAALLMMALAAPAQTPAIRRSPVLAEGSPESAGMSPQRMARIGQMCEEETAAGRVPGMVALVARKGKIVHWKAYGMADPGTGRKLKRDDIFRIASQTKAITATAVMMLWEEGRFRLDDPIANYLPEFRNMQILRDFSPQDTTWTGVPAQQAITIRHLLTHTSGIGYGAIDSDERMRMIYRKAGIIDAWTTEPVTLADNIKRLAAMPLHFEPGTRYSYSEGLDVLGYFVEVISGMPFDQFLKTRIFDPLGMADTYFYVPAEKAGRLAAVQYRDNGVWTRMPAALFNPDFPVSGAKTYFSGGGGLCSTVKDYAIFLQMYLNGGEYNGTRLLSRTTVETIMRNQTGDLFENPGQYYGLAFGVVAPEGQAIGGLGSPGTFDWGGFFNTLYFADPREQVIGLLFKQTIGPIDDQTGWKFRQLVFQAIDD